MTSKEEFISETVVKILASCPYPYMSIDGFRQIPAAEYAAIQAKTMADAIYSD